MPSQFYHIESVRRYRVPRVSIRLIHQVDYLQSVGPTQESMFNVSAILMFPLSDAVIIDQWSAVAVRLPVLTDLRYRTSFRGRLAPTGSPNGVSTRFKSGLLGAHVQLNEGDILTHSGCRYATVFRVMCDGEPSWCIVHLWRPLAYYVFITLKLTSCHLLLYVIYMCQNH